MKIIFGLGNPGAKYRKNRHNVGYMVLDKLADAKHLKFKRYLRLKAKIAGIKVKQTEVILVKPSTFMNNSGLCVEGVLNKYGSLVNDFLIIYDDIHLSLGRVKLKTKGSSGGHQGMNSIISALDTNSVSRLRIGIGQPEGCGLSQYVLSDFTEDESSDLTGVIADSASACIDWIKQGTDYVMRKYN